MSEFEKLVQEIQAKNASRGSKTLCPPAKTFDLLPDHFAAGYEGRPVAKIKLGLRVPSEIESRTIEAESARVAADHDGDMAAKIEAYNLSVFTLFVARGICSPHDVTAPHPLFELPEDMLPLALTPAAIRHLFDQIELLQVQQSPVFAEATPEEVLELSDLLAEPAAFDALPRAERLRVLRYLRFALDSLRGE